MAQVCWPTHSTCSPFWCEIAQRNVNDSGLARLQSIWCDPGMPGIPFCCAKVWHRFPPQPEECTGEKPSPVVAPPGLWRGRVVMAINHEGLWRMSKSPSLWSTIGMGCGEKRKLDQAGIMCSYPLYKYCHHLPVAQSVCCAKMTICMYQRHFGLWGVCVPPGHGTDQTDLHPFPGLCKHAVAKCRAASSPVFPVVAASSCSADLAKHGGGGGRETNIPPCPAVQTHSCWCLDMV